MKHIELLQYCLQDCLPCADVQENNSDTITLSGVAVMGTSYEGRAERIESVHNGDKMVLRRDPNNPYDSNAIGVYNTSGESLGNLPKELVEKLSVLIDSGFVDISESVISKVVPLSKRSGRAKKTILDIDIVVKPTKAFLNRPLSVVCYVEGDHSGCWEQQMTVYYTLIPIEHAKLIFELWNRYHDEYDPGMNDVFYIGLDGLEQDVTAAREKIRSERKADPSDKRQDDEEFNEYFERKLREEADRYGCIEPYCSETLENFDLDCDSPEWLLPYIFSENSAYEEEYYWIDYAQLTEDEYEDKSQGCFNHWYSVLELFQDEVPVNLKDPDTVSVFGTGKVEALADLSYGC